MGVAPTSMIFVLLLTFFVTHMCGVWCNDVAGVCLRTFWCLHGSDTDVNVFFADICWCPHLWCNDVDGVFVADLLVLA